jgi:dTDP-4-dehydrorhamnose reductase
MRILILGITGMLGNTLFRRLHEQGAHTVIGMARGDASRLWFPGIPPDQIVTGVDVRDLGRLADVIAKTQPDVVINVVGIVKQLSSAADPLAIIPLNVELPHRLAALCALSDARLIHISTDCVFSGRRGNYREDDVPDATDLYGRTKYWGEVDHAHALTLRTSVIGPELETQHGLMEWFLARTGSVRGHAGALFSGLTSLELARVLNDYAIPRGDLRGLYHVAAAAITKYELIQLIGSEYQHSVEIERSAEPVLDRSLNGDRFRRATGYVAPTWPEMIRAMHGYDARRV